jgi:hypothetical protein
LAAALGFTAAQLEQMAAPIARRMSALSPSTGTTSGFSWLGARTHPSASAAISVYDPDESWTPTGD